MAKLTKTAIDKELRTRVLDSIYNAKDDLDFHKVNERQLGLLLSDVNDHVRYVRINVVIAEERDDVSAEELMAMECEAFSTKQAEKAEKAKKKEAKIAKDKARREAEAKAKEKQANA